MISNDTLCPGDIIFAYQFHAHCHLGIIAIDRTNAERELDDPLIPFDACGYLVCKVFAQPSCIGDSVGCSNNGLRNQRWTPDKIASTAA